jgi:hypothetical protein
MAQAEHVTCKVETINTYTFLVTKPDGKKQAGRPRCRCVDNIKIYIIEIGCGTLM